MEQAVSQAVDWMFESTLLRMLNQTNQNRDHYIMVKQNNDKRPVMVYRPLKSPSNAVYSKPHCFSLALIAAPI